MNISEMNIIEAIQFLKENPSKLIENSNFPMAQCYLTSEGYLYTRLTRSAVVFQEKIMTGWKVSEESISEY